MPTIHLSMPRPALPGICVAALLLAGCGNNDIRAVQNTTLPDDDKITIAKVLKDRKACDKTEWEAGENSRGQKIVSYKCYFSTKELNREQKKAREQFIAKGKNTKEMEQAALTVLDKEIKAAGEKLQPLPKDKEPDLVALEKTPAFVKSRRLIEKIDAYAKQPYDLLRAKDFFFSDDFADDPDVYKGYSAEGIKHDYHVNQKTVEQKLKSGQSVNDAYRVISGNLRYFHDNYFPNIKNNILKNLENHIETEKAKIQKENVSAKRKVEVTNRPIQREIDLLAAEKERLTRKVASYGKDFEKQLKQRAEQEYPDFEAVFEAFEWEVDRQGRPSLEIGGLMYQSKQNGDDFRRYNNPAGILNRIAKFDAKNFANYRQELGRVFAR